MPEYKSLQSLCDDVARELEHAERDHCFDLPASLALAEASALQLYRDIVLAVEAAKQTSGQTTH